MWAEAQVPYKPPAQGDVQEQFVDLFKASKGDRVKIAQEIIGTRSTHRVHELAELQAGTPKPFPNMGGGTKTIKV